MERVKTLHLPWIAVQGKEDFSADRMQAGEEKKG